MTAEYFTKTECACGCGNLLPATWANGPNGRTRKYLYGHSPALKTKALPKSTSAAKMIEFFDAELALQEKQVAVLEKRHRDATATIQDIRAQIDDLRSKIAATRQLRTQVQAHFRQED